MMRNSIYVLVLLTILFWVGGIVTWLTIFAR
jgi:hypothetical protein